MHDEKSTDSTGGQPKYKSRSPKTSHDQVELAGQPVTATPTILDLNSELEGVINGSETNKSDISKRSTESFGSELWHDIREPIKEKSKDLLIMVWGILVDLIITLVILGALQLLHIVVESLRLPDWVKATVSSIHEYSYIIVIVLVALGFILQIAGYLFKSSPILAVPRNHPQGNAK